MNKKNNSLTALLAPVFCLVLAGCFGGRMASSGRGGEVVGVSGKAFTEPTPYGAWDWRRETACGVCRLR